MKDVGTKNIVTERLVLRRIEKSDAKKIFDNWTSDPIVARYVRWDAHKSIKDTEGYVDYKIKRYDKEPHCYDWIVTLKVSGEPIGEIEAVRVNEQDISAEVGYCYGKEFWGKGYATEALKSFIEYMFNNVGVEIITACHISPNLASGKVMQKSGMKFDAVLKEYLVDKNTGERADKVCYSISKEAFLINNTLDYYNKNAKAYSEDTLNLEFNSQREMLFKYLKVGDKILDLGCGSGRDSKAFKDLGYKVCAVDGSKELCKLASSVIGQEVICKTFYEIDFENEFDAVWACASLLHIPKKDLKEVLSKIIKACKKGAYIYMSFKYGDYEIERNGRYFTYLNSEGLSELINGLPLSIVEEDYTSDVRQDRESETWYNVVLKLI